MCEMKCLTQTADLNRKLGQTLWHYDIITRKTSSLTLNFKKGISVYQTSCENEMESGQNKSSTGHRAKWKPRISIGGVIMF